MRLAFLKPPNEYSTNLGYTYSALGGGRGQEIAQKTQACLGAHTRPWRRLASADPLAFLTCLDSAVHSQEVAVQPMAPPDAQRRRASSCEPGGGLEPEGRIVR
jgi:hypothetical protein